MKLKINGTLYLKHWRMNKMSTIKPELTIVVTAYNNGLYVRECLKSIYNQTYQNYKVIVVEDKSTDNTKEVIKEYIQDKKNFQLIELLENSGSASLPRNIGIEHTDTEYIMFLDGDDWYTTDACEILVSEIKKNDSDMVCGQAIRTNTYSIWFQKLLYSKTRININLRLFPDLLYCSLSVNKIYKREFLNKHNLRFLNGHFYEDILFVSQAYLLAEKISIIDKPVYFWRVVEHNKNKSVTHQRDNPINFIHRMKVHDLLDDFMMDNKDHIYLQKKNERFLKHDFVLYLDDYSKFDDAYKKTFKETMHVYFNKRFTRQEYFHVREKNRIAAYLLHVGDFEAFEDYMEMLSNHPISNERIRKKGNFLYFHSDKIVADEHFYLNMKTLQFTLSVQDLAVNNKEMYFKMELDVFGVEKDDCRVEFYLENVHSKKKKVFSVAEYTFSLGTDKITVGNSILKFDLYVHDVKFTYECSSAFLETKKYISLPFQNKVIKTNISPKDCLALNVSYSSTGELLKAKLKNVVKKKKL